MIIYFLMCIYFMYITVEGYNGSTSDELLPHSQHIWHSYVFNTGAGNREELHFSNAELNRNFTSISGIIMWKSLQIETEVVVIGLGEDFLFITTINGENNSFTYKHEMQGPAKALAVFQKWSARAQEIESYIIVAIHSAEENYKLMWYQILPRKLKFLWDWKCHPGHVIHMDVIKINHEPKLVIISKKNSAHKNPSAEIYSFHLDDELDVWIFEKINLVGTPSSIAVFESSENVFFCVSFPSAETIHIFRYPKALCSDTLEKKHFVSHQKIFSIGLESITPFQVGFDWYLAVASRDSGIYNIGEDLLFRPLAPLSLGHVSSWLAVPVDTYREETLLLADTGSDISAVAWAGNRDLRTIGSFIKLACGEDIHCSEKIKKVALNKSTAFTHNGHQSIIASVRNGIPLYFKLITKLKPLPSKTALKLKEIANEKILLEKNYTNQLDRISQLLAEGENMSKIDSVVFSEKIFETKPSPETLSQEKHQDEILTQLNGLKTAMESLTANVTNFLIGLKSAVFPEKDGQNSKSDNFLTGNATEGATFYGNVVINELSLRSINGYPVNELLEDSFRKNKAQKIGGKKTIRKLKAENVVVEKLGDVKACDIVFADDPWESSDKNILNGDIIWNNKLNILGDVNVSEEGAKARRPLKPVYDALNFKELEITDDFRVQRNINGQPIILPVHNGQLNILDIVNQARFEIVNVKQNLDVEIINGRNFTSLAENILRSASHPESQSVKVEGLFSAPAIEADQLNGIDLSTGLPRSGPGSEKMSEKLSADDPVEAESSLKRSENENPKRVIHVFENLEVEGIVFSDRMNNMSWAVVNDTVKKNERIVSITGTKAFLKSLRTPKARLNGTLNGRFVERIMTDFSDQNLKHPQIFNDVHFKNVSVEGSWNGTQVNRLNASIVRLSLNNGENADLTFQDGCFANAVIVTDLVNGVNVSRAAHSVKGDRISLKSIKASRVVLHGSLITNNKINNMNMTDFNMVRVSLKHPETVDKDIYHYNVSVSGDLNVETLNLNDVSSIINSGGDANLMESLMNGETHAIKKLLVRGNITTTHGVNGFNLSNIFEKGIRITRPGSITGNVTFENIIYFNNVNVTDSIDGISLKHLEKDIAFKHSQVFLTGAKNFSGLKVVKSMRARSLNGRLVEGVVTLKGDHRMRGPVHINGDVIVRGNVTSYSAINDIAVTDLLETYSTRHNSYIHSGDLYLGKEQVTIKNLVVGGKIQNVSLDALIGDSVRKNDGVKGLFDVSGRKTFKGEVKFKGNITVRELVHGVNLSAFYIDVAFVNKPAKLRGVVTIEESVMKDLEIAAHFNSTLINNIDTNEWLEDSIPLDRHVMVSGEKIFAEAYSLQDVSVDFINGHLPSAMISLKKKQNIPTVAFFPRLHTTSDLSVEGFVNGRNLASEYQDSVLLYGPQTMTGKTVFDGEFVVNGALTVDTIRGKPVDSLVTLDTEQVIRTPLVFEGLVTAKRNVEDLKLINNINISNWNERSVLLNRNQVLIGLWTVKGKVKSKNIEGEGLFYSFSLPKVHQDIQKARLKALELRNATESEYSARCSKLDDLSRQFSELPYLLDQFEMVHEIESPSVIDSVITFKISKTDTLVVTFENECLASLYHWNKDNATFDHKRQINIGPVAKWLAIHRHEATYLVTSSPTSLVCEDNLQRGNIWVFRGDADGYAHLLTTNAFVDIAQENATSDEFFTLDENGVLQQWKFLNQNVTLKISLTLGSDKYRFIDFRIMRGLAVSNGREIKQIDLRDENDITHRNLPLSTTHLLALPVDRKLLTAMVLKDKIVVYENLLEEKVYSVIHTYRPGSALWLDYGPKRQAFLIVGSHHRLIEVYEYKGVSGLVKKMSIQMFSNRLQSVELPVRKYQMEKFMIVIQRKKLGFVRAAMFGDYFGERN